MLFEMVKNKKSHHIGAVEENGKIKWISELPESCVLEEPVKQNLVRLLNGLFQVIFLINERKKNLFLHNFFCYFQSDEERIWSKKKFFSEASKTCTLRKQASGKQSRNKTRRQARKQLDKLKT